MRALAKLTWLESKLFLREPIALLFTIAFPLVLVFVLAGVFSNSDPSGFRGVSGPEYYVVSYIGVVIGAIGLISLPAHVATYRERGILRRFRASSVSLAKIAAAQGVVSFVVAVVASLVLLGLGGLAYQYGRPAFIVGVVVGFVLAMLCFVAIAFLIAGIFTTTSSAQAAGFIFFFPTWLLSGAGPPLSVLPDAMRRISDFLPMSYAVRAVQDPWFGFGATAGNLLILAGIALAAAVAGLLLYRQA